eukprot:TRINITY_DN12403_c0_g1_i1.p5 TRINITY_DN12403_c0_g1~~TRINITY_DN12403_c0_g1_i1.p5  ORF type:complete len:152 (+),score=20.50 TRINITY_DN12403_c0_g1_i1:2902-3357(+)
MKPDGNSKTSSEDGSSGGSLHTGLCTDNRRPVLKALDDLDKYLLTRLKDATGIGRKDSIQYHIFWRRIVNANKVRYLLEAVQDDAELGKEHELFAALSEYLTGKDEPAVSSASSGQPASKRVKHVNYESPFTSRKPIVVVICTKSHEYAER